MKKTPLDLASSPVLAALNTIVAASALAGVAAKSVPSVNADDLSYDTKLQKSVGGSDVDMTTYTTTHTQSFPPPGQRGGYQNDDSKTTTDQF
jgi:hypothetical protein